MSSKATASLNNSVAAAAPAARGAGPSGSIATKTVVATPGQGIVDQATVSPVAVHKGGYIEPAPTGIPNPNGVKIGRAHV